MCGNHSTCSSYHSAHKELINVICFFFSDLKPVVSKTSAQLKSLNAFILKRRTNFSNLLLGYVTILRCGRVAEVFEAVSPVRLHYVLVTARR